MVLLVHEWTNIINMQQHQQKNNLTEENKKWLTSVKYNFSKNVHANFSHKMLKLTSKNICSILYYALPLF